MSTPACAAQRLRSTRRQSQRPSLSRLVLLYVSPKIEHGPFDRVLHEPRQRRSWLIFDVATISFGPRQVTATFEVTEKDGRHFIILADHGDEWTLLPLEEKIIEKITAVKLPYEHFYRGALDAKDGAVAKK